MALSEMRAGTPLSGSRRRESLAAFGHPPIPDPPLCPDSPGGMPGAWGVAGGSPLGGSPVTVYHPHGTLRY